MNVLPLLPVVTEAIQCKVRSTLTEKEPDHD